MNIESMTQQQIRAAGIEALKQHIGVTGMIRFLQQNETGNGDYTKEKKELLGDPSLDQLIADIQSGEFNN
jgi:hypothetical protein